MAIGVFASCEVKPEKVAEFKALVQQFLFESRKHSGCISYDCGKILDSENSYAFVEKWASKEELDAHLAHPFFVENAPDLVACTQMGLNIQVVDLV